MPTTQTSLRTITLGALLDTNMPPRRHLLAPWLREQESVLVWAAPGVGKTMLTLSLALAIAGGGELLGWRAPHPARVLIIDGEMPLDDLQGRLVSLSGAIGGIDMDAARSNLKILARHHQAPDAAFPDFGDEKQQDAIIQLIRSYDPAVVILDNLSTLATLDDENGAAETQRVVRLLARLKQARIGVIVVHHSGKNGKTFRGSSMLATTFEVIIGLTRDAGADALDPTGSARFNVEWTKFRGLRDASIGDRSVLLKETPEGLRWTAETPQDETLNALAVLVRSGKFATRNAAGKALPKHLWPNEDSPPSDGWISGRFKMADAKGILPKREVDALLKAAGEAEGDVEADLHDDL
ncbi:AAA family ATPase [Caulobacter hibisci]|uniref:AAA family ATPase n=1 Tax=Caulobacter hibisci TaxID=2035993 RepID=A0ABS0T3J3_9CAUL|nr:AAA family ATPase [Caulobacter hibisci]MBI1686450.1 AAA family ATPase [Caulobacter hibisci]